jgi:hypothetical protein
MKAIRVEVATTVNILVDDDEDHWEIKQNALHAIHDKIHFLEKDSFYINYESKVFERTFTKSSR